MRVELEGGEWVEIVTRLNHAQLRRIRRAASDPELDSLTEGVCAMVTGWLLHDTDGHEVPCPTPTVEGIPSEALDTIPADVVAVFGAAALEAAGGQPDPKGSDATSSASPPAPSSTSHLNSGTPISSPLTRVGRRPTSPPLPPS